METTGSDGRSGSSLRWSYRGNQIRSNNPYDNSSSSGTIVSATYTTSRGSRLSSISMDAVKHFELALDEDTELVRPTKKSCIQRERTDIKSLVQEFFGAPSVELSINISSNSGDTRVLERWFSELGVAWVLHLPDGDDASAEFHHSSAAVADSWIRGLHRILEAIRSPLLRDEEVDQPVSESDKQANNVLDKSHFAIFIQEAMLKMLSFVDFAIQQVVVCINGMPPAPYKRLHTLLAVYEAMSDTPDKLRSSLLYSTSEDIARILQEMEKLFSAKRKEVSEAIWSTTESIRTRVLESIDIEYADGSSSSLIPKASSDIHKPTLAVMEFIRFLCTSLFFLKAKTVGEIPQICHGKYVSQINLPNSMMDMVSCLLEKLVKMSESFPDQGLRFLFMLNNTECIRQSFVGSQLYYSRIRQSFVGSQLYYSLLLHKEGEGLSQKVEAYMENYLQACWEPVLSCLFSPTPLCFGINHSLLLKFESEFKKTYTTQKLWKVPDPTLRKRLRTTITNKIVPRYTEYIDENNITTPGVAPQDMQNMLEELFEG